MSDFGEAPLCKKARRSFFVSLKKIGSVSAYLKSENCVFYLALHLAFRIFADTLKIL